MRGVITVGLALLSTGCALDLTGLGGDGGGPGFDGGADAAVLPNDAGDEPIDAGDVPGPDGGSDAGPDPAEDAGPVLPPPCPGPDSDTLALYTFDAESVADAAGSHHGRTVGSPVWRDGPAGCGRALGFGPEFSPTATYGEVPDSGDWDLASGSVDFWAFVPSTLSGSAALVTRDANGATFPGHFAVFLGETGRLVLRIQGPSGVGLCSSGPAPVDRWFHVGVTFGAPGAELWIDGVEVSGGASSELVAFAGGTGALRCDRPGVSGIAGNANPWTFGIGTNRSSEGSALPTDLPLRGGTIDHVRISSVRRDFAD